ncbi:hypothetical protein [Sinorhizobium sp. BG8]|uniref:hypothetical protein n=1 Tax=Sinorhizobium sp. BG8 TaxID=2613773 RepID=UPI00193EADF3|nr:hypothetical protein [Sinorhizobium sp. BG8]QRM54895.1 hypothetical protein F3Y30_10320 [Sinorhizobium sp. BG8]
MARTTEEWSALLGSALSKMALVYGTDAPNAYLPDDCYPVIAKTFEVAMNEARAEGYAAAMRDIQLSQPRRAKPANVGMFLQFVRALQMTRRTA